MKKLIYSISVVAFLTACNVKAKTEQDLVKETAVEKTEAVAKPAVKSSKKSYHRRAQVRQGEYAINNEAPALPPQKPKGLSKSATGAIIGGVVGAGTGAVIDKDKRVRGAVIGGIIGAGGGYAIGRSMDKKSGRVEQGREYRAYKKAQGGNFLASN